MAVQGQGIHLVVPGHLVWGFQMPAFVTLPIIEVTLSQMPTLIQGGRINTLKAALCLGSYHFDVALTCLPSEKSPSTSRLIKETINNNTQLDLPNAQEGSSPEQKLPLADTVSQSQVML